MLICEACNKPRKWLKTLFISSDDTMAVCFVCLKQNEKGRQFNEKTGKYQSVYKDYQEDSDNG